jgi:hypothetical protein
MKLTTDPSIRRPPLATGPKRPEPYSRAIDRELIELAKTLNLEAIVKRTGRKPEAVLKMAKRLGIKIEVGKGRVAN